MKIDFDVVRKLALALPDVEENTIHGAPSLKVRGNLLACPALHKSAEPDTLVVMMDFADRDALIEDDPNVYYLKDHYLNYPCVLVRLSRVRADALRDLVTGAYRYMTAKTGTSGGRRRRRTAR